MESRDQYLTRNISSYPIFQTVNQSLSEDATLLFVYMRNLGYLCNRKFISDTFFEAHTLQQVLSRDSSAEGISLQLQNMGVTHLLFDNQYVFGKDSAFFQNDQETMKTFLDTRATLIKDKNGYFLYRL